MVIQFAVDCLDCPWTVRTVVLVVWGDDLGAVFLAKDVGRAIAIIARVFVGASQESAPAGGSELADADEALAVDVGGIPGGSEGGGVAVGAGLWGDTEHGGGVGLGAEVVRVEGGGGGGRAGGGVGLEGGQDAGGDEGVGRVEGRHGGDEERRGSGFVVVCCVVDGGELSGGLAQDSPPSSAKTRCRCTFAPRSTGEN